MITILTPKRFDPTSSLWQPYRERVADLSTSHLTVVTYNVCFTEHFLRERCAALLQIIKDCEVDIICLQEVTPVYLNWILEQEWIRAGYYLSDTGGSTVRPYGVLLLSKIPLTNLLLHDLPSIMARKLLVAEFHLNNQVIQIATVHLESGGKLFAQPRTRQLKQIFPLLARSNQALLMGDFNFCASWREENARLDPNYLDMWAVLRRAEPGYTEDTNINLMRLEYTQKHKQVRFDRILVRSARPGWRPTSVRLLGTAPISLDHPNVFPSDHFGLVGELAWP